MKSLEIRKNWKFYLKTTIVMSIFVFFMSKCPMTMPPLTPEESAKFACETFIERFANDPDNLTFMNSSSKKEEDGTFTVAIKVRGKNVFNATITSYQVCILKPKSDGGWDLVNLQQW